MDEEKKARLEAHGWRVGSAEEFLDMTPEEATYCMSISGSSSATCPQMPQEEAPDSSSASRVAPIEPKSRG